MKSSTSAVYFICRRCGGPCIRVLLTGLPTSYAVRTGIQTCGSSCRYWVRAWFGRGTVRRHNGRNLEAVAVSAFAAALPTLVLRSHVIPPAARNDKCKRIHWFQGPSKKVWLVKTLLRRLEPRRISPFVYMGRGVGAAGPLQEGVSLRTGSKPESLGLQFFGK